jgi:(E)-4-hydroxy-3-methylbut-2-enyl-diphosphate synthase
MSAYVRRFERRGFYRLVLSIKSSDVRRTIEANRRLAVRFDYPIHLGLTHAGLAADAELSSAVAVGALLAEGIGDTVRVSVAGDPVLEVKIASRILESLGLRRRNGAELIVCPTCGRADADVVALAERVGKVLKKVDKRIRVAVMGCVVNGPGEAADADLAVCAASGKAFIYRRGKRVKTVPILKAADELLGLI